MSKEVVKGYEEFRKMIKDLQNGPNEKKIYLYFRGEKDKEGKNWCPDCNEAESIIAAAKEKYMRENDIFVTVDVGNRTNWKDLDNSFRTDGQLRLLEIPTIMLWETPIQLKGDQCKSMDLLEMFFNESGI